MKKLLLIISILFVSSQCYSAPIITSSTSTINGSNFGTKSPAAPIAWDTFESGTDSNDLSDPTIGSTWTFLNSGTSTVNVKYSNTQAYDGSLSAKCRWKNGEQTICAFGKSDIFNPSTDKVYLYYKRYMVPSSIGIADSNVKQFYLYGDGHRAADNATDYPQGMVNIQFGESTWGYLSNAPGGVIYTYDKEQTFASSNNKWQTWEIYTVLNTVGESDGIINISLDGDLVHQTSSYTYAQSDGKFDDLRIGHMYQMNEIPDTGLGEEAYCYYDNVYVDNTQERVMVCANSDMSGNREIQIPTVWSDTSITCTWNQGSFTNNDTVYLFVVDSTGTASTGLEGYFLDGTFYESNPVVLGVSENIISCTSAGTKITSAPFVWDNGEARSDGEDVSAGSFWEKSMGTLVAPVYNNDNQRDGSTINIYCDNTNTYNSSFAKSESTLSDGTWFFSYWFKCITTGTDSRNVKPFGIRGNTNSDPPDFRCDFYPNDNGGGQIYFVDGTDIKSNGTYSIGDDLAGDGEWHRRDFIIKHGDPNTSNGFAIYRRDISGRVAEIEEGIQRTTEDDFGVFIINYYFARDGVGEPLPSAEFWYDDIYVDSTQARVEVANNSTYLSSTHSEIQIPTDWSNDSITCDWNQGSFNDNETVYLFIISAEGAVSNGLEGYFLDGTFYQTGATPTNSATIGLRAGNKSISLGNKSGNKTITIR